VVTLLTGQQMLRQPAQPVAVASIRPATEFALIVNICWRLIHPAARLTPQEAICEQGMKDSSISTITSATTPDNAAANHIFNTLGFYHSHTVDVWPAFPALREYEAKVGFVPGQSPPDRPGQLSMLDFIPGEHNSLHKANTNT